jgi:dienelactone hydrolase
VNRIVGSTIALAASVLAIASAGDAAMTARIHPECVRTSDHAREAFIRGPGGLQTATVELGTGREGVLLAHEVQGDLCDWLPYARVLASAGFRVLAFDFDGSITYSGKSKGGSVLDFPGEVSAAAGALRTDGARSVVLIGSSFGGTTSLVAAAAMHPPPAVVAVSTPATFLNMNAAKAVYRTSFPLLLVATKDDVSVLPDQHILYRSARTDDKQSLLLPGGDHGIQILAGTNAARAKAAILSFAKAHSG